MFALFKQDKSARMTLAEAIALSAKGEMVLLDIRDGAELAATGRAKGALHVPLAVLTMKADPRSPECLPALKSGKPIGVYCASGARSAMARGALARMGHAQVHNLGGLAHWKAAGGPVTR